jgi:hypothetical protein
MAEQWSRDGFRVTTDPNALDIRVVHDFLHQSYWAQGIPLAVLQQALAHSLNFGEKMQPTISQDGGVQQSTDCHAIWWTCEGAMIRPQGKATEKKAMIQRHELPPILFFGRSHQPNCGG